MYCVHKTGPGLKTGVRRFLNLKNVINPVSVFVARADLHCCTRFLLLLELGTKISKMGNVVPFFGFYWVIRNK